MGELDILRQRMEHAELRLRTAHSARERECSALNETWEQIRARFIQQNTEMAGLRARLAELEDQKEDLIGMVRGLLAAVEDGVEHMRDATVPRISTMAGELLGEGREADPLHSAANEETGHEDPREALSAAMPASASAADETDSSGDAAEEAPDDALEVDIPELGCDSLSPGIRDLINRIGESFPAEPDHATDLLDEGDELARDLREIEDLRNELNGLRARMSVDDR
jgi:hypothetical protein